jgi:hypothetical protein
MKSLITILALPLLFGCGAGPSHPPRPSPSQQMAQYQSQLNEWRVQQKRSDDQFEADQDYNRLLNLDLRVEEIYQREETKRVAIEQNAPLPPSKTQSKVNKKEQDELRKECEEGFDCGSGDCQYPPDDLCLAAFAIGVVGSTAHPSSSSGPTVNLNGATIENFFWGSAGSTGSDRSNHSRSVPVFREKEKRIVIRPPDPPIFPKSSGEVWGGVVVSIWRDALGAAKSLAPWFFGADVLKTLATSPNNYVAVGDDLTSGGDNNTLRGDYVSKPVVFATEE